jgi:hypothetical protein
MVIVKPETVLRWPSTRLSRPLALEVLAAWW